MTTLALTQAIPDVSASCSQFPQRRCACGDKAGISGNCSHCETFARLGDIQDSAEQAADSAADAIVADRSLPIIQRIKDKEEDRPQAHPAVSASPTSAKTNAAARAVAGGGRPLANTERAYFEPRFQRDLSAVRLHTEPEAQVAAQGIGARAFTHRNHIAFAAGQHAPETRAGRHLLAHEITHTLQRDRAHVLRRSPAASSSPPTKIPPKHLTLIILENATGEHHNLRFTNFSGGNFAFFRKVYPLDTIHVTVQDTSTGTPIAALVKARFGFPEHFERSDASPVDGVIAFRVIGAPETEVDSRVYLSSPAIDGEFEVVFKIGVTPLSFDPVEDVRFRNRAKKRNLRGEQAAALRKLRADRKTGDDERDFKAERKALRKTQKAERKALREARKSELKDARAQHKADIAAARASQGEFACTKNQRFAIQKAMTAAIDKLDSALRNIRPKEPPDKFRTDAIKNSFNLDISTVSADEVAQLQQLAVDVLNIARTSILLSDPATVQCGGSECGNETGAYVQENVRGNPVAVCQLWIDMPEGYFKYTDSKLDAQAFALIHEFAHLAGVTGRGDEFYLKDANWAALPYGKAKTMADAFAAFAWLMGSSGLD